MIGQHREKNKIRFLSIYFFLLSINTTTIIFKETRFTHNFQIFLLCRMNDLNIK